MTSAIDKVKTSVVDLAAFLDAAGLDARFGVVPFTDAAPSQAALALSADVPSLSEYVSALVAEGGDDSAENGVDAVLHAVSAMDWRPGAQKVLMVMTDTDFHLKDDGTPFTTATVEDVLTALGNDFVVHTVSNQDQGTHRVGGHLNARLLSCVTGGSASYLSAFLQQDLIDSVFAKALSKSTWCQFATDGPLDPHDVRVDVIYEHEGQTLFGSATRKQVTYK